MEKCKACSTNFPASEGYPAEATDAVSHGLCADCLQLAGYSRCADCEEWFPAADIYRDGSEKVCEHCRDERRAEDREMAYRAEYFRTDYRS